MGYAPPSYRVGYGKPPLHTRFRKGQSGNPRDRKSALQSLAEVLQEALDAPVAAKGTGRGRRRTTRREAIVTQLVVQSAGGDLRATKLLFDLMLKGDFTAGPERDDDFEGEDPREKLIRMISQIRAEKAQKKRERRKNKLLAEKMASPSGAGTPPGDQPA
jgi:hypothetical protein